jgi:hypothetical protein
MEFDTFLLSYSHLPLVQPQYDIGILEAIMWSI